jgi:hypothetical protein
MGFRCRAGASRVVRTRNTREGGSAAGPGDCSDQTSSEVATHSAYLRLLKPVTDCSNYSARAAALLGPIALGFPFHPPEALVVVGELLHVRERDLAGEDRVVSGDVRLRVVRTMFELNIHAGAELLEVVAAPVDADRVADAPSLVLVWFALSQPRFIS